MNFLSSKTVIIILVILGGALVISFNTALRLKINPLIVINNYNQGAPIGFVKLIESPQTEQTTISPLMVSGYEISWPLYIVNSIIWVLALSLISLLMLAISKKRRYE